MNFLMMIGFLRQKPYAVLIQKELFSRLLPFHEPGIRRADCSIILAVSFNSSLPDCLGKTCFETLKRIFGDEGMALKI